MSHVAVESRERVSLQMCRHTTHGVHHLAVAAALAEELECHLWILQRTDGVHQRDAGLNTLGDSHLTMRNVAYGHAQDFEASVPKDAAFIVVRVAQKLCGEEVGNRLRRLGRQRYQFTLADVERQTDVGNLLL